MDLIERTLPGAAQNIALDEALLLEAEQRMDGRETLRLWEPTTPVVVVGRASSVAQEVHLAACRRDGVPVLRRSSGGSSIVTACGCLMYAVVLDYARRPQLRAIGRAHQFVLDRLAAALAPRAPGIECCGISDLAVDGRKVSGNSLRCRREWMLYHGTLLHGLPIELIEQYLRMPARQPDYRAARGHVQFVTNLSVTRDALRAAVISAWEIDRERTDWPHGLTEQLVTEKYSTADWNFKVP